MKPRTLRKYAKRAICKLSAYKGYVTYHDQDLPIVGRVCIDHIMIDLGQTNLQVGDEVTVINNDPARPNSVVSMQVAYGLFAYTTCVGLSSSVRRQIV